MTSTPDFGCGAVREARLRRDEDEAKGVVEGAEKCLPSASTRKCAMRRSMREERAAVRKHPLRGQAALIALNEITGAGKLIRSYRERYDGAGYPDAIQGLEIPLRARILCVAGDYEAAQEGTLPGLSGSGGCAESTIDQMYAWRETHHASLPRRYFGRIRAYSLISEQPRARAPPDGGVASRGLEHPMEAR